MEELKNLIKISLSEIEDDINWDLVLNPDTEEYLEIRDLIFYPEYDENNLMEELSEDFFEDFKANMLDIIENFYNYELWLEFINLIIDIEL